MGHDGSPGGGENCTVAMPFFSIKKKRRWLESVLSIDAVLRGLVAAQLYADYQSRKMCPSPEKAT